MSPLFYAVGTSERLFKPLRVQRYTKKMTCANKRRFFCEKCRIPFDLMDEAALRETEEDEPNESKEKEQGVDFTNICCKFALLCKRQSFLQKNMLKRA